MTRWAQGYTKLPKRQLIAQKQSQQQLLAWAAGSHSCWKSQLQKCLVVCQITSRQLRGYLIRDWFKLKWTSWSQFSVFTVFFTVFFFCGWHTPLFGHLSMVTTSSLQNYFGAIAYFTLYHPVSYLFAEQTTPTGVWGRFITVLCITVVYTEFH